MLTVWTVDTLLSMNFDVRALHCALYKKTTHKLLTQLSTLKWLNNFQQIKKSFCWHFTEKPFLLTLHKIESFNLFQAKSNIANKEDVMLNNNNYKWRQKLTDYGSLVFHLTVAADIGLKLQLKVQMWSRNHEKKPFEADIVSLKPFSRWQFEEDTVSCTRRKRRNGETETEKTKKEEAPSDWMSTTLSAPSIVGEGEENRLKIAGRRNACVFGWQGQNRPKRENDSLFPNFVNGWGILLIIGPNPNIETKCS